MATVKEQVTEKLANSTLVVRERVIAELVEQEQSRRVKAVLKVLGMLDEAKKAGYRIKPDMSGFDNAGMPTVSAYTKPKLEELKKNQELVTKLETALNEALDETKPNFDKIFKLVGGDKDEKPSTDEVA